MLLARLAAAFFLPALALAAEDNPDLRQLDSESFKSSIAHGAWLVEHYSPRCPHCRAFAPTWEKIATDLKPMEKIAGFHMAQVNCLAQGDLCNDNDIKGYPQLNLYVDGQFVVEYKTDRNHDILKAWIEKEAINYARSIVLSGDAKSEMTTANTPYLPRPNSEGKVVEVNSAKLKEFKDAGPVFIDFYAPWCPHCKTLRPVLEELASEMRGQINIVAVNCDDNPVLCSDNGVKSYPTLKLHNNGTDTEYSKARSVSSMKEFLKPMSADLLMKPMTTDLLPRIAQEEDVFMVYLQSYSTELSDLRLVEETVKPFLGTVPVFTSNDPRLYSNLSITGTPSSVLLAFAGHSTKPVASLPFPLAKQEDLTNFLTVNQYPLISNMTKDNVYNVLTNVNEPLVVVGIVHSDIRGEQERAHFARLSRAVRRGERKKYPPIRFVTIDDTWMRNSARIFGVAKWDVPALVVVNGRKNAYYDAIVDQGERYPFSSESSFTVLEQVWANQAEPKRIENAVWRGGATWRSQNPYKATFLAAVCAVGCFILIHRLRRRRGGLENILPIHRGGYVSEKGYTLSKGGHRD